MGSTDGCSDGCEVGNIDSNVGRAVISAEGFNVGVVVDITVGLNEVGGADVIAVEGTIVEIGLEGFHVTGTAVGATLLPLDRLDGTFVPLGLIDGGGVGT